MTSINGVGAGLPRLDQLGVDRQAAPAERLRERAAQQQQAAAEQAKAIYDLPQGATAPAPGVDPQLWEMLSVDERVFYQRNALTGPLTYTPSEGSSGSPGTRLGGRIDVKA